MEQYIRGLNLSQLRELWDAQDDLLLEHEKTFDDFYQELMKGHDSNDKELTYIVESYLRRVLIDYFYRHPRVNPEEVKTKSEARTKKLEELRAEYNNKTYADLIGDSDGFYKWLSKKNSQDVDRNKIKHFLDSIKLDSVIELESLNTKEKEIAKDRIKQKFQDEFGRLAMTEKFLIHYRIDGQWKTRTLTPEIWNELMASLDTLRFVYGFEESNQTEIRFSDEAETRSITCFRLCRLV